MDKKNIPNKEAVRKGIIGFTRGGNAWEVFVSVIGKKYYMGYCEIKHGIRLAREGGFRHVMEAGKLSGVVEIKDFKHALRAVVSYGM
jgi:hypothetical protein